MINTLCKRSRGTLAFAMLLIAGVAQAQWMEGWELRRPVLIANACGVELTNQEINIRLDSSFDFTRAASNGGDVRVTSSDGETLLDHWIETWDPVGRRASVWVRVPAVPPGGGAVYLYYGGSGVSTTSDGYATFAAYDGFENYGVTANPGEWARYRATPLLTEGPAGSWDAGGATFASVIWDDAAGEFRMYYHGFSGSLHQIGLATSPDGITWTKYSGNPIVTPTAGAWDASSVRVPMVWKEGAAYHMMYTGLGASGYQIGYATSSDGIAWTKHPANPVFNDPTWAHGETENWGVMKVGSQYLMWYSDFGVRRAGIAVSTNLVNWAPYQANPVFDTSGNSSDDRYSQFCPFSFKYGDDYYVLVPSYDSGANYSKQYLYRSSSPFFPAADRELVRIAHTAGANGEWDDHDSDTPFVLTLDVERTQFYNDELWCYYAGEGGDDRWKVGLHHEADIAAALSVVPPLPTQSIAWTTSGTIGVVYDPVRQGASAMRLNDTSASTATTLSGTFASRTTGVVGGWMRRSSTTSGDVDIYLYGGTTLSCAAGLGRNGDFHYWNGAFQPTGVAWSINAWYLVTLAFNTGTDRYDFVVCDANLAELVRIQNIAFGNAGTQINQAAFYTSSGFVGMAYVDDVRVRAWCGADPVLTVGPEQNQVVPVLLGGHAESVDGTDVEIAWTLFSPVSEASLRVLRAVMPDGAWIAPADARIVRSGTRYSFRDGSCEPGATYRYRVEMSLDASARVQLFETGDIVVPECLLALRQNSPNPFNPRTTIRYSLPRSTHVLLTVYDQRGRLVRILMNAVEMAGERSVEWNGQDAHGAPTASGTYIVQLVTDQGVRTSKVSLAR